MDTIFSLIASAISSSLTIIIPNRGRKGDRNNPQNIVDENALLRSRLAEAESRNREQEERIALLEKQIGEIQERSR